ncbi:hypothetical protein O181_105039 [Austropuccinia psidii MF-1]|uniref:Uncharacterized protein n=1 Tax=Austropuccinia psidii MF-1 TaxID=1389203 RepID=A0A9Q3PKQ9_9BASI|nr:hypothetical protein [Austropuccinia psidii MF-1]
MSLSEYDESVFKEDSQLILSHEVDCLCSKNINVIGNRQMIPIFKGVVLIKESLSDSSLSLSYLSGNVLALLEDVPTCPASHYLTPRQTSNDTPSHAPGLSLVAQAKLDQHRKRRAAQLSQEKFDSHNLKSETGNALDEFRELANFSQPNAPKSHHSNDTQTLKKSCDQATRPISYLPSTHQNSSCIISCRSWDFGCRECLVKQICENQLTLFIINFPMCIEPFLFRL